MPDSILILQDETPMRALLMAAMEDQGHAVSAAATAVEALRLARRRNFDLVLAEVRRPALEGLPALGALQRARPSLKTVVITGGAGDDNLFRALAIRVDAYLYKPFELVTFQRLVRRVLRTGREGAGRSQLLSRLVEGSRRLAHRAGESLDRVRFQALEAERDRLYQQFLRGVRSGGLQAGAALKLWDQLEVLELARQQGPSADSVDWQKLREGYRYMADLVVALGRLGGHEPSGIRGPEQVPRELFAGLYGRLRRGELSVEQLKAAPLLRTADPDSLRRSPETWQLHRSIWGAGSTASGS